MFLKEILFSLFFIIYLTEANLVNEDVSRTIDLKSHLVRVITKVTLSNTGKQSVSRFQFIIDPKHSSQLANVLFTQGSDNENQLSATKKDDVYTVKLQKTLLPGATVSYSAEETYFNSVTPFPKEISQSQNQLVVYEGNHFFFSPYITTSQTTTVQLPSATVESYSKYGNAEKSDTTITYGDADQYENVAANSQNEMRIHYENNNPFLVVTRLERVIELSHWGNIAVEETFDIAHHGAKLKGSFSRYDYQRQMNSGVSSVKSFKTILPSSAQDVYYRDQIGNISTSNLFQNEDSVDLEIRPRFPLFGGWKTHYYIGYNLPSYNYLYTKGDTNALKMRVIDHVMQDQLIEDFTLKIILPEGCKDINVQLPFEGLTREDDRLHFTYLDTSGRPTLTFTAQNLVDSHIEDFILSYNFNKMLLLHEPLLIISFFFLLFLTVIIIVRLDFTIAQDSVLEARMRLQGVIEQVKTQQDKRAACFRSYKAAIETYKAKKNQASFTATCKSLDKDFKAATSVIDSYITQIRTDSNDAAEKVVLRENEKSGKSFSRNMRNLQSYYSAEAFNSPSLKYLQRSKLSAVLRLNKLNADLKEKMNGSIDLAKRLVIEKVNRDSYADNNKKIESSMSDLLSKIELICDSL